jgi:predicted PurR-regulated permease PerM
MDTLFSKLTLRRGIIATIILLILIIVSQLWYFVSGVMGAITLYVITRRYFLKLIDRRKHKKWVAATWIIFLIVASFAVPIWVILEILIPQIDDVFRNPQEALNRFQPVIDWLKENKLVQAMGFEISNDEILQLLNRMVTYIPGTLEWIGQMFANMFVALFILYFMFMGNRRMEAELRSMLPFSEKSRDYFICQNVGLIRSNAYGIPILAFSQGVLAIIGYMFFGVDNAIFWGLLTGAASVFPVVGTMIVWVPLCLYQIAIGNVDGGLILSVYCLILVGGIDNVLRFTLLRKMADIHPIITVFGVLLGLKVFGVMGLVFGPLILSLPQILYAIFKMEKQGYDVRRTTYDERRTTNDKRESTVERAADEEGD